MAYFILIHGFNDRTAGANNIDKCAPILEAYGHTVDRDGQDYRWFGLLRVQFARHSVIARIVTAIRRAQRARLDVVIVGYSNGANFAVKAARLVYGPPLKMILVHPALPTKFTLSANVSRCLLCYTRSDLAVRLASYIRWLIPGWGRAGAVGYRGADTRIVNRDYSDVAKGHGGLWRDSALENFCEDMDQFAKTRLED